MAKPTDAKSEKRHYHDNSDLTSRPSMLSRPCNRSRPHFAIIVSVVLLLWISLNYLQSLPTRRSNRSSQEGDVQWVHSIKDQESQPNKSRLVPLEAHIMSKCPDAKDCLRDLVVPAMEKIVDMVDFKLSFIGSINSDDTIKCMHGETECLGNMLSLCAKNLFPNNTVISLGFTTCLVSSYSRIPDRSLVENCALEHGIDFDALNACVSEEGKGLDLLRESVERSKDAAVTRSCTVRVDGKQWCVRDGGKWKECNEGHEPKDLIAAIKKLHDAQ